MLLPSGIRWLALAALIANVSLAETSDEHEEQDSEENEKFVPTTFTKPSLSAKPLFFDYFPAGEKVGKRWVKSTAKKDGADAEISKYDGEWNIGPPSEVAIEGDHGLIVVNKARHHAIAAKLDKPFVFGEKPLVAQYEVQFEQGQECGGGYIKLLSEGAEQKLDSFQDKTPYTIMFGPDKCGPAGKVHLIFKYRNPKNGSVDEYHAKQPDHISTSYWDDHESHLFTLVVQPSGAYEVRVDQRSLFYGNMLQNLHPSLTPPEMIADPEDKKPEDWDERAEIEDETAVKPDDWDEAQPKEVIDVAATKPDDWLEDEAILIPDPNAVRPSDWDDEMDGEWEAPMIENPACQGKSGCGPWKAPTIPNPLYKGKWRRPKIANPAFKGIWAPRQIANPNFFEPTPFGGLAPVTALGIELWTMSERIIFDNILIADDEALATEVATQTFTVRRKEADRLAVSKGEKNGFLASVISATEERPWLWVVFALAIILPVIGIAVCCCGRKSTQPVTAADALRKKTDAIVPDDDEVPNLVGDDDSVEEGERVEEVEMEKPAAPSRSRSASRSRSRSRNASRSPARKTVESEKKLTMADLEDDDDEEEEEVEKAKSESSAEPSPKPSPKASPKPTTATKRKPRKAE